MTTDVERFTGLVQSNSSDLLRYLLRRVEVAEDAADLLSDTLLTTWRRLGSAPRDDDRARMWMFGVARRVLANHHRGAHRRTALAERLRAEIAATPPMPEPDADETHTVRQAIRALTPRLREVVMLVHWEGFSLAEAAQVLGVPASTARNRYARARAALRSALAPSLTLRSTARP